MKRKGSIGLTGGIACGKSEVAGILAGEGVPVIDTDAVAHGLLVPGHWVFEKVVDVFGRGILGPDGGIDRRLLGRVVFQDEDARAALNGIMHPVIYRQVFEWLDLQLVKHPWAVAMIPLLYETGRENEFERVLAVAAYEDQVMSRLKARGLTASEARARISAQMPLEEKIRRADDVIWNNEDLPALKGKTLEAWQRITVGKEKET